MQAVYDQRLFVLPERMEPRVEALRMHNAMNPVEERLGRRVFWHGLAVSCLMLAASYLSAL